MFPNQNSTLSLVKLEEMESADERALLMPYNYPYFLPVGPISTHSLYLAVKQQIQQYERTHGLQIQPKCRCRQKNKKREKRTCSEAKRQSFEEAYQEANSLSQKNETVQQKEGRNVNSNLFRMFFRRLEYKIQNHPHFLEEILKKIQCNATIEEFQKWIKDEKVDYRNYMRVPQVKKLFCNSTEAKRLYAKALRIIFKHFLDDEAVCCYLTSRKIKKDAMKLNLAVVRTIMNDLFKMEN